MALSGDRRRPVKVSLRSDRDVAAFSRPYGGGGHTKASGLSLEGSMAEAQAIVLAAARQYLAENGNGEA
jgi:nanoRNase/pAp phosphatase (c-di-AMP/oligoRNAs hydrolase)